MKPARKDINFDYSDFILKFREVVLKNYEPGEALRFNDYELNSVFYDNIVKPSISNSLSMNRKLEGINNSPV